MRKYIFFGLSYCLVVIPGALNAWLSLSDRFSDEDNSLISISTPFWYQTLFPILGLVVLLFGVWWTRDKDKGRETNPAAGSIGNPIQHVAEPIVQREVTPESVQVLTPEIGEEEPNSRQSTFLNASAADLVGIYDGRTTVQAQPLVEKQIGNWVRIKGNVTNVRESYQGGHSVALSEPTDESRLGAMVHAYFGEEWNEVVSSLSIDQDIMVFGRIAQIGELSIRLEACSFGRDLKD